MQDYEKLIQNISYIEKKLGYTFRDKDHLVLAFVHSSFINENKDVVAKSNERLEFLGDAVLGLIVGEYLFSHFPNDPEGSLSYLRSKLIETSSCARFIKKLGVESFILMGKGEKKNFLTKANFSILADLFEAIIGAIYLDGGIYSAKEFLISNYESDFEALLDSPLKNWKAELQDYSQKKYQKVPVYKVVDEVGPDHSKTFHISVFIDDMIMGSGYGASKKSAQQAAACEALYRLNISEVVKSE